MLHQRFSGWNWFFHVRISSYYDFCYCTTTITNAATITPTTLLLLLQLHYYYYNTSTTTNYIATTVPYYYHYYIYYTAKLLLILIKLAVVVVCSPADWVPLSCSRPSRVSGSSSCSPITSYAGFLMRRERRLRQLLESESLMQCSNE